MVVWGCSNEMVREMERYSDQHISGLASDLAKQIEPEIPDELIEAVIVKVIESIIVKVTSDPRLGERFSAAIDQSQTSAENGASHPRAKPRAASAFSYDDVETPKAANASPEACEMLAEMREMLTTAPQLRSRPKLIDIADDLDVPLAKRDSMPRIAQKMLTAFADRDTEEIQTAFDLVKREAERGTTASYMRLANGIMGNSGRNND